jgi:hypothetical protein
MVIRKTEIGNWRQVAQDRDRWRKATGETLILLGLWGHRRRRRRSRSRRRMHARSE